MRIFNGKFQSCGMYLICIHSQIYILLLHNLVSIPDFHIHLYRFCRGRTIWYQHFSFHIRLFFRHIILYQINSGRSIIGQWNIYRIGNDQVYITINAAIEIEITDQRHYIQLQGIIHLYQYFILGTILHLICYFKNKRTVATPMFTQANWINKNRRDCINAFKTQE